MNKTTKITLIAIAVIILGFVGYRTYAIFQPKQESKSLTPKEDYIILKADHASKEFDVLQAKKELARKEKEEEEARINIQGYKQEVFSGFTN